MNVTIVSIQAVKIEYESKAEMDLCWEGQRQLRSHNELKLRKWHATAEEVWKNLQAHVNICPTCQEALAQMNQSPAPLSTKSLGR